MEHIGGERAGLLAILLAYDRPDLAIRVPLADMTPSPSQAPSRGAQLLGPILRFFTAAAVADRISLPPTWLPMSLVREQIMTGLIRVSSLIGTLALALTIPELLRLGLGALILPYTVGVICFWALSLSRRLPYALRGGALLIAVYGLALTELLNFGFSVDAHAYLMAFSLYTVLFFSMRSGVLATAISTATLLLLGVCQALGWFIPWSMPLQSLTLMMVLVVCVIFVAMVGSVQIGVSVLFRRIEEALREEQEARRLLEDERNMLEQRVAERVRDLQAQNAELEAFAHTVAHDIKNPLSAIMGYGHLLLYGLQGLDQEAIAADLQRIIAAGQKATRITDELLLLAQTRTVHEVAVAPLDMAALIDAVEARLHHELRRSEATLVRPERWPLAYGYAAWVEEIWFNYLSNALKYGGTPPRLVVGADQLADGMIRFWVQDNGPGLSDEEQGRLFTAFTRLHTERAPGHGLGLTIVQRIAARLGGEVGVESVPDQGSRFSFTLPAAAPAAVEDAAAALSSTR